MAYLNQTRAREHLAELELLARQAPVADLRLAGLRQDLATAILVEDEKNAAAAATALAASKQKPKEDKK